MGFDLWQNIHCCCESPFVDLVVLVDEGDDCLLVT
jgi:hypothetical protein